MFVDTRLTAATARLARNFECVSLFVDDDAGEDVIRELAAGGTVMIVMRCVVRCQVLSHYSRGHVQANAA